MAALLSLLGILSVLLTIHCPASVSGNNRQPRDANAPAEINCHYTSWSEWSKCDPCERQKHRSRSILRFGQFGGVSCNSNLGESQLCVPTEVCEKKKIDCGNDFVCDSGRCIKQRLKCNVDNDCGDYSDESVCNEDQVKSPCRQDDIKESEVGKTAGSGVNVLGMKANANAFDNDYFNGICSKVRDGNTRTYYRLPWNVAALTYQTQADKSFTSESFSDSNSVVIKIVEEKTNKVEASISGKIKPTELKKKIKSNKGSGGSEGVEGGDAAAGGGSSLSIGGEGGIDKSWEDSVTTLKEYTNTRGKEFLRVSGKIQLAKFQMRTRGAVLSTGFIEDVNALPSFYEKSPYFAFLETYGTHYASSGSVGGKYDLVYIMDQHVLQQKDMTTKVLKDCLGLNAGLNVDGSVGEGQAGVKNPKCQSFLNDTTATGGSKSGIEKTVSFVQGGTTDVAARLNEKLKKNESPNIDDFAEWAKSLVDAPVVLDHKSLPIHTLIPVDLKDAYIKQQNLQKAIQDYINEHSTCKCQPCHNGGTVAVIDGSCLCKCPELYEGAACQTLKTVKTVGPMVRPSPGIDGRWGCWEDSSPCVDNEKSQTRQCNNPAPQNGGKPCAGDVHRKIFC